MFYIYYRPKSRQEERKRHLKTQGRREQHKDKKASGRGTVPKEGENCLLCDKHHHSTQSCRFWRKCRKLLIDKFKTSKDETAAVAEESKESTEDDICFMVHEDPTVIQINCNVCRSNEQGKPPILLFERIPAYSFDRFCSPAFGDMCLTHREDAVPDEAQRYTWLFSTHSWKQ